MLWQAQFWTWSLTCLLKIQCFILGWFSITKVIGEIIRGVLLKYVGYFMILGNRLYAEMFIRDINLWANTWTLTLQHYFRGMEGNSIWIKYTPARMRCFNPHSLPVLYHVCMNYSFCGQSWAPYHWAKKTVKILIILNFVKHGTITAV